MVYELRTYRVPQGRMPDILARFEHITFGLFKRHRIEVVGFWTKKDRDELVYICRFENEDALKKAWDDFRADPEWIEARKKTESDGPIVAEVISEVLHPAGFSPLE